MNKILRRASENFVINKTSQHLYNTRENSLDVPQVKTTTCGSNSLTFCAICLYMEYLPKQSQYHYIGP